VCYEELEVKTRNLEQFVSKLWREVKLNRKEKKVVKTNRKN
jgi:hypothetical protein